MLDSAEQQRVDSLLEAARRAHYLSMVIAGMAIALVWLPATDGVTVPLLDIRLPHAQGAVALYLLTIALTGVADRMFRNAFVWMSCDTRRPPFAWFALGSHRVNFVTVTFWLVLPVLITTFALTSTVGGAAERDGISAALWAGLLLAAMPRIMDKYLPLIARRQDHRGGQATFSIWLLHWYRIARHSVVTFAVTLLVLSSVPEWRTSMRRGFYFALGFVLVMMLLRAVAGSFYARIDEFGQRYGFPRQSVHEP